MLRRLPMTSGAKAAKWSGPGVLKAGRMVVFYGFSMGFARVLCSRDLYWGFGFYDGFMM